MDDLIQVRVARDEKSHLIEVDRKRGSPLSELLRETATDAARRVAA